ncbi:hypothetical protein HHK36_004956 [Tetracentron sinense]|uniref:Cytochrome P450 n=1 Tax=Tetracentron sinense TaxID=13715 RepID=A0A835DQP6_TETSI|nr:hypothetical protein HHK36_004956 [Tetracentron sinense]
MGPTPSVTIMDPELIRDVLSNKVGHFAKRKSHPLAKLLASGLAKYEGEQWAKHRRIINPAFHLEKLKQMGKVVLVEGSRELDVWPELQNLTGDVMSRAVFGSSYEEARQIFQLQNDQTILLSHVIQSVYIPGLRFLPTKRNNRMKEIDKEVQALLRWIVNKREKDMKAGEASNDDLLALLIESNRKDIPEYLCREGDNLSFTLPGRRQPQFCLRGQR